MAATASPDEKPQPTYGNWRRPKTGGLGNLGIGPSILLILGLAVVMLTTLVSRTAAVVLGLLLLLGLLPLAVRDKHGRTLLERIGTKMAWRRAERRGSALYRSGPLGRTGYGTAQLPGLAARSTVMEAGDSYGRRFALITYPSTSHHVVVLTTEADGAGLVDQRQVDTWVAHWGGWLASLANEPGLVGCSVTVETAPDTGQRLRTEVESQMAADAPALAQQMLTEVLEQYPVGGASITTRIALTYSGAPAAGRPRRDADAMAVEIGLRLPSLTDGLAMTGAGAARPMTATEIAEAVRVAYDPAVGPLVEQARAEGGTGITWDEAGPLAADESWDSYRHDSAHSVTWCMAAAPRGEVLSSVLTGLLAPHPDIDRKRITLLYRPHDPASAAKIVEDDKRDALVRAGSSPRSQAATAAELQAAEQTAAEEASGAGVVRFGLLATATVADPGALPRARAAMEGLAGPARIRLRPVWGTQSAAFAACLPIGLVLPAHLLLPDSVRASI
ncbi:SCO6880 family protein [Streptomyces albidoflavus]